MTDDERPGSSGRPVACRVAITDPRGAGEVPRLAGWARSLVLDARDLPFVGLATQATLTVLPSACVLYLPGVFSWWLGLAHFALVALVFVDRYTLMLHNTCHRPLFRRPLRWLDAYVPVVLGPFFGQAPHGYFAHHLGMHHPENNLEDDISSTMRFERDNALHFARYFARFFLLILLDLPRYLWRKRRPRLARRAVVGEVALLALFVGLSATNWRATLCVFLAPYVLMRFAMMAGNWAQHAFIDPARPDDLYLSSITCINTRYNRRCFNDGYHIGHHLRPTRHWTELPSDLEANLGEYARRGAIVFDGLDFFTVWALLMVRDYDTLARHVVPLSDPSRSHAAVVALLRSRTRPFESRAGAAAPAPRMA